MSIDSHLMTKFSDINLREIEENTPFLEDSEFKKKFLNFDISLAISGTLMRIV